ncbi:hypothetical protein ACWDUD_27425 [Rhodococcus sp. NPDC003382]|uniref:hypothetical protein n=1 Tax=unclassified Rhodococcus (in: high G+C Gram-positive bacteria) TaxID=192944 RepID=UPI0018CF2E06|nr:MULTISPECIES: hypothetical protein [unclassified Rhodococcus (in: high G+C Gram-positive bacteria)]MBH0118369.1 hypothetical protein [Rhodococcus sp. CX]MCK8675352.1 hypothetical protein [Rhodococcus sp. HM1]
MTEPISLFQRLTATAEAGQLFLEPDAARMCSEACSKFIDSLVELSSITEDLVCRDAFGTLPSAQALGQKFDDKAIGPGGFAEVLQQHIDTVTRMKALFEAAGKAYVETDAETRARIAAAHPDR